MEKPTTELTHADSMWDLKKKLTNRNSRAQMGDKTTRPRISSRAILSGVGAGGSVWRIYLPRDGVNLLHVTKEVYFSFAKMTLYLTPVWRGIWRSETSVGGPVSPADLELTLKAKLALNSETHRLCIPSARLKACATTTGFYISLFKCGLDR